MKDKILVSIDGSCRQNPHGEMGVTYLIEFQNGETEKFHEVLEAKRGNTMITAEYASLSKALERLIELDMTKSDILIKTTSSIILMHHLGHIKPNRGYYVGEALRAAKYIKRFMKLKIVKVQRKDNIEVVNLSK